MRVGMAKIFSGIALGLIGAALMALGGRALIADSRATPSGEMGFVVSDFSYGLAEDASATGACPRGMSRSFAEIYAAASPDARMREGESEAEYGRRIFAASATAPNGENLCMNPQAAPDPNFRTVTGRDLPVFGVDLDGRASSANDPPAPGMCAHDDFRGLNGERGVDNQFYRVVGCLRSFQSAGLSNGFGAEMLTGAWGILLTLKGVGDLRNDASVEVGIYANADPMQVSAARQALPHATYNADSDPRFRAVARGRIVNGVLTTEPVDVRFHHVVNNLRLERPLREARLRLTFDRDGGVEGFLSGYTPVEALYNYQFGYRDGKDRHGELAPLALRTHTSVGAANVLGHTCNGVYAALQANADGHRDPRTGRCTSISTHYRIKAIPAFVMDAPAQASS